NTLKTSIEEIKNRFNKYSLEQVPWCKEGFYLDYKQYKGNISFTPEHKKGFIFIQESASMIPPIVLNPSENDIVLDYCAAPGSKTTQLAALMKNNGIIIANDINSFRLKILIENLKRCSVLNTIVTQENDFKIKFDKILLDTPCSGTGKIRGKTQVSINTLKTWNEKFIKKLSNTQKTLITNAFSLLKPNGTLVYSTCSLEPEEDEQVVDFLLSNNPNAKLEKIDLPLKSDSNYYLKLWPQYNNTEGFFITKIKKVI
ncbi:MAG: NOL1/NOP2/sun family putative RNA methylase, partial [Candidatus Woesearchaeota archaeon]